MSSSPCCSAGPDDARAAAERIRRRIELLTFADPRLGVTVSIGLATAPLTGGGGPAVDFAELMAAADRALYRAKHDGRNRVDHTKTGRDPAPLSAS